MTNKKGIFIKNIYYMLAYAFQVLQQTTYEEIAAEEFDDVEDLFAAILAKGIAKQLKQGLYGEYITTKETTSVLRGKVHIQESMKYKMQNRQMLNCDVDTFSENTIYNQILKTTAMKLHSCPLVSKKQKKALGQVLCFLGEIESVDLSQIQWNRFVYHKNNQTYEMLMNICYFVEKSLLQTTEPGVYPMAIVSEVHMAKLYEKFVLEYYKKNYKQLEVSSMQVSWDLDNNPIENQQTSIIQFLPVMQTDITIRNPITNQILIIDTKYYGQTLQTYYDAHTIHSSNLYQIFTYVKNKDKAHSGTVAGLLLYAKTEEEITPDALFSIGGNPIGIKTLDLNCVFSEITRQLDEILTTFHIR